MSLRNEEKKVSYIPATKSRPDRKLVFVVKSGDGVAFSINKIQKPRAGLCISEILHGKIDETALDCTIMVTVFRDDRTRPFDGGFIHVTPHGTFIEGLHQIFHKSAKTRPFEYFRDKDFREGDQLEFDVGDCMHACVLQARLAASLDRSAA